MEDQQAHAPTAGEMAVHEAIVAIEHRFVNHPPQSPDVGFLLDEVTEWMVALGIFLDQRLPAGREKSLAITKLEECSMWAKAAVARNQDGF